MHFIIPQYFQTLSGSLSGSLDKLIIAPLFGFTLLGNYSLGLQVYALLTLLPAVVVKYIIPQDSSGIENKKLKSNKVENHDGCIFKNIVQNFS